MNIENSPVDLIEHESVVGLQPDHEVLALDDAERLAEQQAFEEIVADIDLAVDVETKRELRELRMDKPIGTGDMIREPGGEGNGDGSGGGFHPAPSVTASA